MFYKKSEFRFTDNSNEYIIKMFRDFFQKKFSHDLYSKISSNFIYTQPGKELLIYFRNHKIKFGKIQAFVSNNDKWFRGNPHIDLTTHINPITIQSRFNVLILGNPTDRMYWWDKFYAIEHLELKEFTYLNGIKYKSYGVKGNTIDERWNFVGEPTFSVADILCPSAFVKTNCVHTVNVSKGPRLILTVQLDTKIEDLAL